MVSGATTVQLCVAGVASTLPTRSTACTANVWAPTVTFSTCGEVHGSNGPPSSEHSNTSCEAGVTLSVPEKANVATLLPVLAAGPESIAVSGAVVSGGTSIVHVMGHGRGLDEAEPARRLDRERVLGVRQVGVGLRRAAGGERRAVERADVGGARLVGGEHERCGRVERRRLGRRADRRRRLAEHREGVGGRRRVEVPGEVDRADLERVRAALQVELGRHRAVAERLAVQRALERRVGLVAREAERRQGAERDLGRRAGGDRRLRVDRVDDGPGVLHRRHVDQQVLLDGRDLEGVLAGLAGCCTPSARCRPAAGRRRASTAGRPPGRRPRTRTATGSCARSGRRASA